MAASIASRYKTGPRLETYRGEAVVVWYFSRFYGFKEPT